MYRTARALRDMSIRSGDAEEAVRHAAEMAKIERNLRSLWVTSAGHPAAFREEGGHRRLRPDPWCSPCSSWVPSLVSLASSNPKLPQHHIG